MTQQQFFAALEQGYKECVEISKKKNADYAGTTDPFKNFRVCESLGIPAEVGILVRMTDKLMRVSNLIQPGREAKVKDESIADTLNDLCNYSQILRVYLLNKKTLAIHERPH